MTRTHIVRWLRILLPLLALVILSTMFLISRKPTNESQIPYAEVDARQMADGQRVVAPEYAGVTGDGGTLNLRAREAVQTGAGQGAADATADDLQLDWERPDGLRATVTAPGAGIADDAISLNGGVRMTTSTGWQMQAPQISAARQTSQLHATGGVQADAPFGRITADRMDLAPAAQDAAQQSDTVADPGDRPSVLTFSGGVRLIYQP